MSSLHKEEGTEKHRLHHCPDWHEVRRGDSGALQKMEAKGENVEERVEVAKRYRRAPSQRKPMEQRSLQYDKVVRKAQDLGMSVEGFKGPVATDGSLLGKAGKCGACGWAVVQLGSR